MILPKCPRPLEKSLGNHGKELRRIRGAVVVQESVLAGLGGFTQRVELRAHHPRPRPIIVMTLQRRRAVAAAVLEIELVRELVQHQVHAIVRLRRAAMDCIPGENERAESLAGVTEPVLATFLPNSAAEVSLLIGDVS